MGVKLRRVLFLIKYFSLFNNKLSVYNNNSKTILLKKNLLKVIINFFFKSNKKLKFVINFLIMFKFFFNFLKKEIKNQTYFYYTFIKKNFNTNKSFSNLNSFFIWLISSYELIFLFKKLNKKLNNKVNKSSYTLLFILKKKRKKFFLRWINTKVNFIKKKQFLIKLITFFFELVLNFKKSTFFKFKNLIYKNILLK